MNQTGKKQSHGIYSVHLLFILLSVVGILVHPEESAQGVIQGLQFCIQTLIPSMFPFLVISNLLISNNIDIFPGLFCPYLKMLGIESTQASQALFCGITGGFAAGASAVDHLFRKGAVSSGEAAVLLAACAGAGPGFVVNALGYAMLGNAVIGWILFLSQLFAQLVCSAAVSAAMRYKRRIFPKSERVFLHAGKTSNQKNIHPDTEKHIQGLPEAIQHAVLTVLTLCGTVAFFSFLSGILLAQINDTGSRYKFTLFLELSLACQSACESGSVFRTEMCSIALSIMGLCIFFQIRSVVSDEITLFPLICTRILHLPVALLFFKLFSKIFPHALFAGSAMYSAVPSLRMPPDVIVIVFMLCLLIFRTPASGYLHRTQKEVQ